MEFADLHPYVYYATPFTFHKGQVSKNRICYASSIYLISEGKGTLHTEGRIYPTAVGSLVYIPAGQSHDWIADESDPMTHICCYFDWTYVNRQWAFHYPSMICFNPVHLQTALVGPDFPYPLPEHIKIEKTRVWIELFQKFYTANQFTDEMTFFRSMKVQSSFQQFIEFFLGYVLQEEHLPDPRMNKLLTRLDQDLLNGQLKPIHAYYEDLQISRGYFFDLFKKTTGMPPTQYINQFRINMAKEDLRTMDLSVTEIAEKHGFSSIHYFSKLFRKMEGLSPTEYRDEQASQHS